MDIKNKISEVFLEIQQTEDHFSSIDKNLLIDLIDRYDKIKNKDDKSIINSLTEILKDYNKND